MKLGDRALHELQGWVARPQPGDVLDGRFELRQRIGEGGMGVVHAAFDRAEQRPVAVKIIHGGGAHDTARFEREVGALEKITHPAVVRHVHHGEHEGVHYLVMDRLEGCSLAERLRLGRLTLRDAVVVVAQLASALASVHAAGIVHRDVKPTNIFLVGDLYGKDPSDARLLDFGLARHEGATTLTARGSAIGTPGYMAPERIRGDESSAEPPGDVFSLGCVLFECLLGRAPFEAETTYALLARVLLEVVPLVRRERPEVPAALESLVVKMLAKDLAERPRAADVAMELESLIAGLEAAAGDEGDGDGAPREELAPGVAVGDIVAEKYRIDRRLGEGGMGVVLEARHLELGTQVAIKVLRAGGGDEARFLREAQATSRIESEHVARVLDVGRMANGGPFIVMERLQGEDLARRLAGVGRIAPRVAVGHVLQACSALREAHALGIVHRDVKPSNLFLVRRRDGSEMVKVLDFGISKLTRALDEVASAPTATAASVVMGSIAYMAPEQLESAAGADARSDIWSLGVVLFELVSGVRPFVGENAVAVAARIAGSSPPRLRDVARDAPAALEAIVARCLMKDAGARYGGIDELADALRAITWEAGARGSAGEVVDAGAAGASASAGANVERERGGNRRGRGALYGGALLGVGAFAVAIVIGLGGAGRTTTDRESGRQSAGEEAGAAGAEASAVMTATAATVAARAEIAPLVGAASSTDTPPVVVGGRASSAPRAATSKATGGAGVTPGAAAGASASASASAAPRAAATSAGRKDLDLHDPALEGR